MKIKLTNQEGKEVEFYSHDVIEKIRHLNNLLLDTYPETSEFCIAIDKVLNEG